MTIGHNGELKAFVERIEKLAEDKRQIAHDMNFVYAEAKATGFDTKIIRKVVALRQKEAAKRDEEQALLDTYMAALGMIADLPLGRAALEREGLT